MASSAEAGVSRRLVGIVTAAGLGLVLAGCVSTEQKAAWLQVENARTLVSQNPNLVRHASTAVRVTGTRLLSSPGRIAIAVRLRNLTGRALNDLPISVGVSARRGRIYLNRRANLDYFSTHIVVIPGGASETWVFSAPTDRPPPGRPFAIVGGPSPIPTSVRGAPPLVRASVTRASAGNPLTVTVRNLSAIPQAQIEIYAVAMRSGRFAAAGGTAVSDVGAGDTATARLELTGRVPSTQIELEALPTLFH